METEEKKYIYANSVEAKIQIYDSQIILRQMNPDGTAVNETVVVMSPQHLKSMSFVLNKAVKAYEQNFGEICLPEDLIKEE